jgi:ring-1,2-phenylacetyl-CoA epoxidase subunit PaaC
MSRDSAYQALAESTADADARWAFGTEATDAAVVGAEISAPVPDGADAGDLAAYCLMLGDDALVYAQRLSEWVSNAPDLEEDVALANLALDLLGQARALLSRAAYVEDAGRDEDALAFGRTERQFRNVALAELSDVTPAHGLDFGRAIARLLLFSSWRLALLYRLLGSRDPVIAAVAAKGVKELTYHRDYAARWLLRLGDGTQTSHQRAQAGLDAVWPHVEELFVVHDVERRLITSGVATDPSDTRTEVDAVLDEVLPRATLHRPQLPPSGPVAGSQGREGVHTEALGHLLAEMQSLARQHPGARW